MPKPISLIFPGRSSPTYVPVGIACLSSFVKQRMPDADIRMFDLNLALWNRFLDADDPSIRPFFHEPSASFFDETIYLSRLAMLARGLERWNSFSDDCRRYVENDEIADETTAILNEQVRRCLADQARILGLSVMYADQLNHALAISKFARAVDSALTIVLGGAVVGAIYPGDLLHAFPFLDGVAEGEGEWALISLLSGNALSDVPGLLSRDTDGAIRNNPSAPAPPAHSLPGADFLPLRPFEYFNPTPVLPILSSRGCRWRRCRFCAHNETFGHYRAKTAVTVVDEMEFYLQRYGARHFYFADQYMDETGLEALSDEILKRRLVCSFHVMARTTSGYTPQILEKASQAGCRWISWGMETGAQSLLDLCGKGTTVAESMAVLEASHRAGIANLLMMIFGLPGSTPETFEETFRFIETVYPWIDAMTASSFVLFETTPFGKRPDRYGLQPIGNQILFQTRGTEVKVRSRRLSFRRIGDPLAIQSPLAAVELDRWQQRRIWMGGEPFLEKLPAEHCLLHLAHRAASKIRPPNPSSTPNLPRRNAS